MIDLEIQCLSLTQCFLCEFLTHGTVLHNLQFVMSWEIPGHHTEEAAFARLNTSAVILGGIMICQALRSSPL